MRRLNLGIRDLISIFVDPSMRPALRVGEVSDEEVLAAIFSVPPHYASTFSGNITARLQVTETVAAADVPNIDTSDATQKFSLGPTTNFTSGITAVASMEKALAAGAGTLDLTALTHRGIAVNLNGLKVKYFAYFNPSANPITIVEGAANGNALHGAAFKIVLNQNDYYAGVLANSQTVAGADKTIDLTGTGTDTLRLIYAAG